MSIHWGARIDGEVYGKASGDAPWDAATWDRFEEHTGKTVTIIHWGQPFGALDLSAAGKASDRGATSLISIDFPSLADIASGRHDAAIDAFAQKCKQFGSRAAPARLEMNGGWYSWGRKPEYVAAWRRYVNRIRAIAPNAKFVWCPNTIWDAASDPRPWFPGNDYVDWVGMDGYNRGTNPFKGDRWKSPYEVFKQTYDRLQQLAPGKPIMVCETASTEYGGSKAAWITNLLTNALPKRFPQIKSLVWFNWNIAEGRDGGRLDWPIESSPEAQAAFRRGISSPYYRGRQR